MRADLPKFWGSTDQGPNKAPPEGRVDELGTHRYGPRYPLFRTRLSTMVRQHVMLQRGDLQIMEGYTGDATTSQAGPDKHGYMTLDKGSYFAAKALNLIDTQPCHILQRVLEVKALCVGVAIYASALYYIKPSKPKTRTYHTLKRDIDVWANLQTRQIRMSCSLIRLPTLLGIDNHLHTPYIRTKIRYAGSSGSNLCRCYTWVLATGAF